MTAGVGAGEQRKCRVERNGSRRSRLTFTCSATLQISEEGREVWNPEHIWRVLDFNRSRDSVVKGS